MKSQHYSSPNGTKLCADCDYPMTVRIITTGFGAYKDVYTVYVCDHCPHKNTLNPDTIYEMKLAQEIVQHRRKSYDKYILLKKFHELRGHEYDTYESIRGFREFDNDQE